MREFLMRFVGVDLAWAQRGGSGLCLIEDGAVTASTLVGSDQELLDWLRPLTQDPVLVAIDAPLIVRNLTGRRQAEQLISRCFGGYHASAHSANLSLPSFRNGVRGEWLAAALELDVDPVFPPRVPVRRAIEVYPHTAIVALFGLATTLKYKAKPGRTLQSRAAELAELVRHLESLSTADLPLDVTAAPRWSALKEVVLDPASGAALARAEDEIDAYVCSYTALYYWHHGISRCRIAGDATDGYILTPVTPELAARFDRIAAEPAARQPSQRERLPAANDSQRFTAVARNADRLQVLLPAASRTNSPHVAQLVVEGEPGLIALVTAEAVDLRLPTIEWTAGSHGPAEASRLWKRLKIADLDDARLADEIAQATAARHAQFVACRYCGTPTPPEHRVGIDVCQECVSHVEGTVF